jgi:hypothetical protein
MMIRLAATKYLVLPRKSKFGFLSISMGCL